LQTGDRQNDHEHHAPPSGAERPVVRASS
jgi:hypothetical protein